jgi:hypothetical protein
MTKKHYVAFAAVFKTALESIEAYSESIEMNEARHALDRLILESTKIMHYDNAAFRPVQFLSACGYSAVQAGHMAATI